ncbi:MAG: DUF2183 domain-containing protein [Actinobacteria bacterium]|uniref:Unannotated protein n=1 Tax=freshwater metagenome TaxID=449393 RepID=A0A6J7H1I2_9ZZZZ|nr:DUF2183 domain-containing protein [Actinomycetota bacterium]
MASTHRVRLATQQAPKIHPLARFEDRAHRFRERFARRRGLLATVVPYRGYGTTTQIRVLCRVVLAPVLRPGSRRARKFARRFESIRGWRSFVSVPVASAQVTISIGEYTETVTADRGGVVDAHLAFALPPGEHVAHLVVEDSLPVEALINVSAPTATRGIICDVDDTVMVTALPRPFLAAWNSFVLNEHARVPTPGMAVFLSRMAQLESGMPVIYLSTGAWNVAPTLRRFLSRNLYPIGTMLLTDWGPTHDRLFRSGREHKRRQLEKIAVDFPHIKWIMVGDDGQHDEEIYGEFEANHPDNVAFVAIRQLSTSEAVLAGGRKKGLVKQLHGTSPWVYAHDGAGIIEQLTNLGVLEPGEARVQRYS